MAPPLTPLHRLQNTRIVLDTDERRSLYRVGRSDLSTVRVVVVRFKKRIPVLLLDVSATGCAVCVPTPLLPQLREVADGSGPGGWRVGLWMPEFERPIAVPAQARYIKPIQGGVRIGFEFAPLEGDRADLDVRLQTLFNQRRAVRARPPAHESIRVEVIRAAGDLHITGLLRDLSVKGVGILVGSEDGATLESGDAMTVRVHLPGSPPVAVAATLRYRADLGLPAAASEYGAPATHLGVEFDPGAVASANATETIGGFVVEQQLRMKREQAEARARAMADGSGSSGG